MSPASALVVVNSLNQPAFLLVVVPAQHEKPRISGAVTVVLDKDECKLYETYYTWPQGAGFSAEGGAVFDLRTGAPRPDGWTEYSCATPVRASAKTTRGAGGFGFEPVRRAAARRVVHMASECTTGS